MEGTALPLEAGGLEGLALRRPPPHGKKAKKAVLFFEVEILDAKTREKLCFLDKVWGGERGGGGEVGGVGGGCRGARARPLWDTVAVPTGGTAGDHR